MPTEWTYPNTVIQYAEANVHISWLNVENEFTETNLIRTDKDLVHIANSLMNDYKTKTYYLVFKEFDFIDLPATPSGLELYVKMQRTGRVTDETVQLYLNQPLGANLANSKIEDLKIYGGENELWGVENISQEILNDPEFGIVLRYQSHPSIPHRTGVYMTHVQLRVW